MATVYAVKSAIKYFGSIFLHLSEASPRNPLSASSPVATFQVQDKKELLYAALNDANLCLQPHELIFLWAQLNVENLLERNTLKLQKKPSSSSKSFNGSASNCC